MDTTLLWAAFFVLVAMFLVALIARTLARMTRREPEPARRRFHDGGTDRQSRGR